MIEPAGTEPEAFSIPLTTGILKPLPSETIIIPSVLETLYPDIKCYSFDLYIPMSKDPYRTKKALHFCKTFRYFLGRIKASIGSGKLRICFQI
jgi:hypothetical protein